MIEVQDRNVTLTHHLKINTLYQASNFVIPLYPMQQSQHSFTSLISVEQALINCLN